MVRLHHRNQRPHNCTETHTSTAAANLTSTDRVKDNPEPSLFIQELRNCAGTNISLGVFSAKGSQIREIFISVPADAAPLGLALQWSPLACTEDVWHILDVMPNSPADVAGLLPYSDYVIGSPEGQMRGDSGLSELIEDVRASHQAKRLNNLLTRENSSSIALSDSSSTTTNTTSRA